MPNVDRRWIAPASIVAAFAGSAIAFTELPLNAAPRITALLPFSVPDNESGPRWMAAYLFPTVALVLWLGFDSQRLFARNASVGGSFAVRWRKQPRPNNSNGSPRRTRRSSPASSSSFSGCMRVSSPPRFSDRRWPHASSVLLPLVLDRGGERHA